MHPLETELLVSLHRQQLLADAEHERLLARAGPRPRMPLRARVVSARRSLGFRLVETGLRLVTAPGPPSR
jgi:hypothetical protein